MDTTTSNVNSGCKATFNTGLHRLKCPDCDYSTCVSTDYKRHKVWQKVNVIDEESVNLSKPFNYLMDNSSVDYVPNDNGNDEDTEITEKMTMV